MTTITPAARAIEIPRPSLNAAMLLFIGLQAMDFVSTLLVFGHGGIEVNPVVQALMPMMGKVTAILTSKVMLVAIIYIFGRDRKRVLVIANVLYTAVVLWNFVILFALTAAPHPLH